MKRAALVFLFVVLIKDGITADVDAGRLWKQVDEARQITFHCLYRHPGLAVRIAETRALEAIVRQVPGGLDEAKARLRLAEICDHNGNLAVRIEHVRCIESLLRDLMKRQPGLEGLPSVLFDACGTRMPRYLADATFKEDVRRYLEARFRADQRDAAEAGFHLGRERIIKERDAYRAVHQQVVERFGDTYWGQYAQLHLLRNDSGRPLNGNAAGQLFRFAEKHRTDELGLKALQTLSFWHGRNNDQRGGNPVANWTKAMEVNLLIARNYPGEQSIDMYASDPKFNGQAKRLEELFEQYFAINSLSWTHHLRQLAKAKGLPEDSPEFYINFWDAVELRCEADQREAVVANRARFFYEWGRYKRDHGARTEMFATCRKALKEFPKSVHAPEMLDLMARALLEQNDSSDEDREKAAALWKQSLESHPDHPVSRWIAVDLALLDKLAGDLPKHRRQLSAILEEYPNNDSLAIAIPYLIGESFEREKYLGRAIRHFEIALRAWGKLSPALRGRYMSLSFGGSSQPWQVRFSMDHKKIREKLALWKQFEATEFRDLLAWQSMFQGDGEARRKHLEKLLADFPKSKLAAEAKCELARQYKLAKQFDNARTVYGSVIDAKSSGAEDVLVARLGVARMNFLRQGTTPKLAEQQAAFARKWIAQLGDAKFAVREAAAKNILALGPAVLGLLVESTEAKDLEIRTRARALMQGVLESELRAALRGYQDTIAKKQADDLSMDVAEIHRLWWLKQRETTSRRGTTGEQLVPTEQASNPWYLVSANITLILSDGSQRDAELSHRFAPLENAATLTLTDIMRVCRVLDIPTRLAQPKPAAKDDPKLDSQSLFGKTRDRVLPVSRLRYGRIQPVVFFGPAVVASEIHFLNKERTRAELHYRYGASGGSEIFEKIDGRWIATGKGNHWIS